MERTAVASIETAYGPLMLPCLQVIIVPIEKVRANTYNPNHVSENNMKLLLQSILDNGCCYASVTIYDEVLDEWIIIDGFHRYLIFRDYLKAKYIPIIVLPHNMAQRMAATVQFNRARGVHQVELMGDLVQALSGQGLDDEQIAKHLGMEMEEVYRLKQVAGIADLFKNQVYSKSWEMMEVPEDA